MRVVAAESSTLAIVGYDAIGGLLQLEFRNGAVYHYFGVPAAVHQRLLSARSKGSFFNWSIRGSFPYCQVSERLSAEHAIAVVQGQE
jgi:hypothetical protein